jgi:spore photoproduct lyase
MITKNTRKALDIKFSGRSSDFITPSFGFGCLFKCAYCYMRRHKPDGLSIAENTDDLLQAIENHRVSLGIKTSPNQTHPTLWSYDLSCNEDFALHAKHHDWVKIFNYFKYSETAMGTLATKYVNNSLLQYNPEKKIRIRFSLMPQELSSILEPNTSLINDRIKAINTFHDAGYDVHINFSPVIFNPGSKKLYTELFNEVNQVVREDIKPYVKAEVIFLTHNEKMHEFNIKNAPKAEKILWNPDRQESKTSSYGGSNLRYERHKKANYIRAFKKLHNQIIPWNEIRYIF